ncbi:MAG TPA: alpha/beta hydrolase [Candidatus Hydrogenedentes bacterium]|nr:alpha/beta hydrolase [Candidatus Hydrogenedentota bacterium]
MVVPCVVMLMCAGASGQGQKPYVQEKNAVYAEPHGIGLLMDVFRPTGPSNGRAIVDIVSSAFNTERININQHLSWKMYDVFCSHGYVVFAIRPGSASKWSIPEMQGHVRMGIRYVKEHAGEYGIEPASLGLIGVSAGGYLACLTALTPVEGDPNADDPLLRHDTRVGAAAPICPVTDVRFGEAKTEDQLLRFAKRLGLNPLGKPTAEEVRKRAEALSPVCLAAPDSPPFIFTHGKDDTIVPLAHSENMVEALEKAGVDVELRMVDTAEHVWDATIPEDIEVIAGWFDEKLNARTCVGVEAILD